MINWLPANPAISPESGYDFLPRRRERKYGHRQGFTLIEMAMVLVVIGFLVGGVLVGQDLIGAAGVRGTITQLEQYSAAVNTFREKTGYLPGDIPTAPAAQFGLVPRYSGAGAGDGNGIIEGWWGTMAGNVEGQGETVILWEDLSAMHLIDGSYTALASGSVPIPQPGVSGTALAQYFPQAKIGRGNYIMAFSGGGDYAGSWYSTGNNYFCVSAVSSVTWANIGVPKANPGLTVAEAFSIDKKIDDGIPTQGHVLALTLSGPSAFWPYWMNGDPMTSGTSTFPPNQTANTPSAASCYDNGGVANTTNAYSVTQNGGKGVNCALSFQFQ